MKASFILLVLFTSLIMSSCEMPNTDKSGLPGSLSQYLESPTDPCAAMMNDPLLNQQDGNQCIKYNEDFYKSLDSKNFASMQNGLQGDEKKQNFIRMLAPAAVKVMEETKIPASVIIAQGLLETGWGTSKVFAKANNMFGHSCFSSGANKQKVLFKGTENERVITYDCLQRRPRNEGHYYMTFNSLYDSVSAYADNLISNPGTSRAYGSTRQVIAKANATGRPAQWREFVPTLGSYAADSSYRKKLAKVIKDYGLDRFDVTNTCDGIIEKGFNQNQCSNTIKDESVVNTGRSFELQAGKIGVPSQDLEACPTDQVCVPGTGVIQR